MATAIAIYMALGNGIPGMATARSGTASAKPGMAWAMPGMATVQLYFAQHVRTCNCYGYLWHGLGFSIRQSTIAISGMATAMPGMCRVRLYQTWLYYNLRHSQWYTCNSYGFLRHGYGYLRDVAAIPSRIRLYHSRLRQQYGVYSALPIVTTFSGLAMALPDAATTFLGTATNGNARKFKGYTRFETLASR